MTLSRRGAESEKPPKKHPKLKPDLKYCPQVRHFDSRPKPHTTSVTSSGGYDVTSGYDVGYASDQCCGGAHYTTDDDSTTAATTGWPSLTPPAAAATAATGPMLPSSSYPVPMTSSYASSAAGSARSNLLKTTKLNLSAR